MSTRGAFLRQTLKLYSKHFSDEMVGEADLTALLKNLSPSLHKEEFVFCSLPESEVELLGAKPICQFREEEGVSLILLRSDAEKLRLRFLFPCRMITLSVHSDLEAVGLLAAVSAALAREGLSVNAVSACFHDHLFVPTDRANDVMTILKKCG